MSGKRLLFVESSGYCSNGLCNSLKIRGGYEITVKRIEKHYQESSSEYDVVLFNGLNVLGTNRGETVDSGLEIIRRLRKKGLPVLVLSIESEDVNDKARNLGAKVLGRAQPTGEILEELKKLAG